MEANIVVFGLEVDDKTRKKAEEKSVRIKDYTDDDLKRGVLLTSEAFRRGIAGGDNCNISCHLIRFINCNKLVVLW
ncbi:MAG: hypothetical protein CM1200mP1_03680 [Candidatus Neomarinimicrobiota bacterium]|nr:MAG: hypothetical protein CM1200mP1_03680 [Candidatus Neomarinimicrobiota bacterium]